LPDTSLRGSRALSRLLAERGLVGKPSRIGDTIGFEKHPLLVVPPNSLQIHDSAQSPSDRRTAELTSDGGLEIDDQRRARTDVNV
jgi:hypothetical protein